MKKLLFIALALVMSLGVLADDVIVLIDATEIQCKIVEVGDGYIKYKRSDNPNGPTFNQSTKGVFYVKYNNGEKVSYNTKSSNKSSGDGGSSSGNSHGGFIASDRIAKTQITPHVGALSSLYGSGYKTQIPPVGLDIEYVSVPTDGHGGGFAIGVSAQYSKWKIEDALFQGYAYSGGYSYDFEDAYLWSIVAGVTGSYNYYFSPKFEVFGTLLLGYEYAKFNTEKDSNNYLSEFLDGIGAGGFAYNISAGVRYHITPAFNLRGQLGYGVSIVDVGLGFRF